MHRALTAIRGVSSVSIDDVEVGVRDDCAFENLFQRQESYQLFSGTRARAIRDWLRSWPRECQLSRTDPPRANYGIHVNSRTASSYGARSL